MSRDLAATDALTTWAMIAWAREAQTFGPEDFVRLVAMADRLTALEKQAEDAQADAEAWDRAVRSLSEQLAEAQRSEGYVVERLYDETEARAQRAEEALQQIATLRLDKGDDVDRAVNDARVRMRDIANAALAAAGADTEPNNG